MNKLHFFVGTTAELIKLFPLMVELKSRNIPFDTIASGQNDISESELFRLYNLDKPKITLSDSSHKQNPLGLLLWFFKTFLCALKELRKVTPRSKGQMMIVHGDTVSTVMGAMLGKLLGMKVAHVEAGLRSFNYFNPFPEELDRVITSKLADYHYAPNDWATSNLKGKKGEIINSGENTLLDSLKLAQEVEFTSEVIDSLQGKNYFVFVIHRQENLFDTDFVKYIVERCVKEASRTHCVLVLHELTRIKLDELGILSDLKVNKNITLIPRLPYIEFMNVLGRCNFIITDGGSNQEESYYLGKPCLILRTHTERVEGLEENVLLSKKEPKLVEIFFEDVEMYRRESRFNRSLPSAAIAEHIESFI